MSPSPLRNLLVPVLILAGLVGTAAAASDGEPLLVVLNKAEASASLLTLPEGKEVGRLPTDAGPHEVAISADGRIAVVANYGTREPGNTLTVLDLRERQVVRTIDLGPYHRPHGILFLDARDHVVVTVEQEQKLLIVGVQTGKIVHALDTGGELGHMVALSADRRRAFVPHMRSATVAALDLENQRHLGLIEVGDQPEGVALHPEGHELWVSNRGADTISVIDLDSLVVKATLPCGTFPIRLAFTPDGRQVLASNARSGDVAVFDAAQREEIARIPMDAQVVQDTDDRLFGDRFDESPVPVGIVVDAAGTRAYVANTNADVIAVIDLESFEIVQRLRAGQEPDGMAIAVHRASGR